MLRWKGGVDGVDGGVSMVTIEYQFKSENRINL